MSKQEEFVLRTVEDREVRFIRLWFTDVLGGLKSVAIVPAELEGAFSEASASTVRRSKDSPGSMSRYGPQTRPLDVLTPALARRDRTDGPDVLRHPCPRRRTGEGRSPQRPQAHARGRGEEGLHLLRPPRDRVLPLPLRRPRLRQRFARCSRARRHRRLLRPRQRRDRQRLPALGGDDARGDGAVRRVLPPRGGAGSERDRPPLRRCADDGRQHHDLPLRDQGGRDRPGVYASFMPKPMPDHPGNGMHTHVSLFEGRTTPSSNPGRPTSSRRPAANSSPASSTMRPRSPR